MAAFPTTAFERLAAPIVCTSSFYTIPSPLVGGIVRSTTYKNQPCFRVIHPGGGTGYQRDRKGGLRHHLPPGARSLVGRSGTSRRDRAEILRNERRRTDLFFFTAFEDQAPRPGPAREWPSSAARMCSGRDTAKVIRTMMLG